MTSRSTLLRTLAILVVACLFSVPASATPSFALVISTGGVERLAVGETLQLHAYPPPVHWRSGEDPKPVRTPLRWKVTPAHAATIDAQGRLTAKHRGSIMIRVQDAQELEPDELPPGLPSSRRLRLVAELEGGRLPRLDGLAPFERFDLAWDPVGPEGTHRLRVWLGALRWNAWMATPTFSKAPGAFPWTFKAVKTESGFSNDAYRDLFGPDDYKRYRDNLTKATLEITGWKDDVVRGKLEISTRLDVNHVIEFTAWLEDPHGLLKKAAEAR